MRSIRSSMGGGERETPRALCGSLALSAQRQSWHRELTLRHQAIPHRSIDQYEYITYWQPWLCCYAQRRAGPGLLKRRRHHRCTPTACATALPKLRIHQVSANAEH